MKRIICMILAITCVFFTGCNSIIYNGNFDFEPYAPPELIAEKKIKDGVSEAASEKEMENKLKKYNIEGVNAFYMLDGHEDDPDLILDFEVLDYASNGSLIYAYMTPCYGEEKELSGSFGTAPKNRKWSPAEKPKKTNRCVTVLMSYNPFTREYKVFFSGYGSLDDVIAREKKFEGEDAELASVSATSKNSLLMVQKLVQQEKYFIFFQNISHVYDKDGNQTERNDYGALIAEETARFARKYQEKDFVIETSIHDVVMDGNGYLYLSLTLEKTKKSADDENKELDDLTEEDGTSRTYGELLCIYKVAFDDAVTFTSTNLNWEKQKEAWLSADGMEFDSEGELKEFQKKNSMDDIKAGTANAIDYQVPDMFSVYESGEPFNLQLVGQRLLNGKKDTAPKFRERARNLEKLLHSCGVIREMSNIGNYGQVNHIIWNPTLMRNEKLWDEYFAGQIQMVKKGLVLLSQNSLAHEKSEAADGIANILQLPKEYQIPGVSPGKWNVEEQKNEQIFPMDGEKYFAPSLPIRKEKYFNLYENINVALMASKSTIYSNGMKVSRYADIAIPYWEKVATRAMPFTPGANSFKKKEDSLELALEKYPYVPPLVAVKEKTEVLERTLYVMDRDSGDAMSSTLSGNTDMVLSAHREQTKLYPKTYVVVFPKGTSVHWLETIKTEAMVAPTSELGLFYYLDLEEKRDGKDVSRIVFQSGGATYLEEIGIPGKIQDAGCLTYGDTEVLVYITTEGVTFYKRPGKRQRFQKIRTTPLSEFIQNTAFSIGTNGNISYVQKVEEELGTKKGSEEGNIIKKGMKSGTQSEIYTVSNFTPMNPDEMILSSLTGGILLHNIKNGLSIQLDKGAYFSSFPLTEDQSQNGSFLCVGYETEEYTYDRMDLAWAKCYTYNLKAQGDQVKEKAIREYLMNRSVAYLEQTHQVVYETDSKGNKIAKIQMPDEKQKKEMADAERLFYGTEKMTEEELKKLMRNLGFGSPSEELRKYVQRLAKSRKQQKYALTEIYELVRFNQKEVQKEPEFLEMEGNLIFTNSPDALKNALVTLQLTDKAIERLQLTKEEKEAAKEKGIMEGQALQEKRGRYYQYKLQAKKIEQANQEQEKNQVKIEGNKVVTSKNSVDTEVAKERMEESEYREHVLFDLSRRYKENPKQNESGKKMEWEEYLEHLLKRVSPDNGSLLAEEAVEEFRQVTGMGEALVSDNQLQKELKDVSMLWELERLILRYKLSTGEYQSSPWKSSFQKFDEEMTFSDSAERRRFFYASDFYEIIKNMAEKYEKGADGAKRSWDSALQEIIMKSGKGIVVEDAERGKKTK